MKQTFYSNGKLLITGEYVVLDGAQALALPTKFGQSLIIEAGLPDTFEWSSFDHDGSCWLESSFSFNDVAEKREFINNPIQTTLVNILHHASLLNSNLLQSTIGYKIHTKLTFPKFWGLGTSSTLINNVSQWLQLDAFTLLKNSFGGSGYDVACAQHNKPIIYQLTEGLPQVTEIDFCPSFSNQFYFVYLNQKQNSREAITNYRKKQQNNKVISQIDQLTTHLRDAESILDFSTTLELHESLMSGILEIPTVKEALFPDFEGSIKSLGAWGGDFVMVVAKKNPSAYFKAKGYEVILSYEEMIL